MLDLDHDTMKALREKLNAGYVKYGEQLLEKLDDMYSRNSCPEFRREIEKACLAPNTRDLKKTVETMYRELYDKIELDRGFEAEYESWADEEVFMFDVY